MTSRTSGEASGAGPVEIAMGPDTGALAWDAAGLVAGVVQDVADGRVLMVGWLDAEALSATLRTGDVHFHSRSRGRLWRKGESSGRILRLKTLAVDCDGDALLLGVEPAGPTCHRETRSCFDADGAPATPSATAATAGDRAATATPATAATVGGRAATATATPATQATPATSATPAAQGFAWLESLWATIEDRASTRAPGSYTVRLLEGGVDLAGRKVTEEATEFLLAAKNDETAEASGSDRTATHELLAQEAGDLLFHALVLLAERGMEPSTVVDVLRARRRDAPG